MDILRQNPVSIIKKTSIIKRLKEEVFTPYVKPTLAITLLELILESYKFTVIDVSGQKRLRNQWWEHTKKPNAIIFVLDMNNMMKERARLEETQEEFQKILKKYHETGEQSLPLKTPLLICVNKIDLIENFDPNNHEIASMLRLETFRGNIMIQFTSAITGVGIEEGFKWLVTELIKIS